MKIFGRVEGLKFFQDENADVVVPLLKYLFKLYF